MPIVPESFRDVAGWRGSALIRPDTARPGRLRRVAGPRRPRSAALRMARRVARHWPNRLDCTHLSPGAQAPGERGIPCKPTLSVQEDKETMETEQAVAQYYTHGSLEHAILDGLQAAGKNIDRLDPHDLAPVDEFHIGGRQATIDFAGELGVTSGMHLLDIGSGLGG